MLLLIFTVLGAGAITVTSFENRIAGLVETTESAATAAESCLGTAVNVIQQTMDQGQVPADVFRLQPRMVRFPVATKLP